MHRLMQLFDELDDLVAPAFVVLTERQWLRGAAVIALVLALHACGASWILAGLVALPAFPLGDLVLARTRQPRPRLLPALARSVSGS
jgi:hypothetical protein